MTSPAKKFRSNETIIRDLDEALTLMKQIHDTNERTATDSWVKAVNQKARELDAYYTSNQHIPNERLDAIMPIVAADDIQKYKELAKADPVEWFQQQQSAKTLYKEGDVLRSKRWKWVGRVNKIEMNDTGIYYYGNILDDNGKVPQDPRFCHLEDELEPAYKVDDRVFVPHMNEVGTIQEINGVNVRLMLDSGTAMQTHLSFVESTIKEESLNSPRKQVQNSPVDETPKMRQLEMF